MHKSPDTVSRSPVYIIHWHIFVAIKWQVFSPTAIQMKRVTIEPCGVIGAHIHPRGTEWGYIISGNFEFGIFLENGTHLPVFYSPGEGVVIPQGSVHYARNTGCSNAEIVVIFDHPSPSVVYVGQALSTFEPVYVDSAISCGSQSFGVSPNQFRLKKGCNCP